MNVNVSSATKQQGSSPRGSGAANLMGFREAATSLAARVPTQVKLLFATLAYYAVICVVFWQVALQGRAESDFSDISARVAARGHLTWGGVLTWAS